MHKLKRAIFSAAATTALAALPLTAANAAGPLVVPWILGHVIVAASRLATLPLAVASAASSAAQPPGFYPQAPGYGPGAAGYYAPRGYNPAPAYYAQPRLSAPAPRYSGPFPYGGGAAFPSARSLPWMQPAARGYYPPSMRYSRAYGAQVVGSSRGFNNRHW
jgi:hypothetical protein